MTALLAVSGIRKVFGGLTALDGVSFSLAAGQILGLVGPNGSGKSTLLNVLSGIYTPEAGEVHLAGQSLRGRAPHQIATAGLARSFQNQQLFAGLSVVENVLVGRACRLRAGVLAASWLGFTGLAQVLLPAAVAALAEGAPAVAAARPSIDSCFTPSAYARLAGLPVGNVVAPMLLGAHILAHSADSVVAAGYHRNVAGAIDTDDFLNAGEAPARAIATRRSLGYVVACRGLPELTQRPSSTPDSFVALWTAGQHWTWLTPLSDPAESLQVFRIEPVP